ncbi:unnamed protein product [Brassicogethes aeneus]|uniref:Uncharacterized protein n=1 Tax=Brassicogethes aeneus TaxID=1431903 RepID=A0A9P0AX48_BRAAE|nr:unnamed protein product [Brassicogethes aeneus]
MSRRLLSALQYPNAKDVDCTKNFRQIVSWLNENHIKRPNKTLKNVNSQDWDKDFEQYKKELGCPIFKTNLEDLQWILGYAIQNETINNKEKYIKHAVENLKICNVPDVVTENPLDKLDFHCPEFDTGIKELAKVLDITPHPDPLVTLKSVRNVISKRLSPSAVENPKEHILTGTPISFSRC